MAGRTLNKVMIIGHLGRDPEVKYLPGGQAVARFSVATNETWVDKDGKKQEKTTWHKVVMFGKLAEIAGQYLSKGRQVYIEGRLDTREWEQDGQKRSVVEIIAREMMMLGAKAEGVGVEAEIVYDESPPKIPPEEDIPF